MAANRTAYGVLATNGAWLGMVRHFDASTLRNDGSQEKPRWAFLHLRGRVDRFDRFKEARDEALKCAA